MSVTTPGPGAELINYAAKIIVNKMAEPHTAPGHWAGALWEAGMLMAPGTGNAAPPSTYQDLKDARAEILELSERLVATGGERDRATERARVATAELEGVRASLAERESRVVDLEGTLAMRAGQLQAARAEVAAARQELAVWRSHGTGGLIPEVVVTRYEGMGEIPAVQEGGGAS